MANKTFSFIAAVLITTAPYVLHGQQFNHTNDHILNQKGKGRITIATGIPYIAVGEYAYGFSDRVTIGVLAGLTPNVEGYGIRARTLLYESTKNFRVRFCSPIIYYPKTKELGGDAWWLTRPNINFEWTNASGFRYIVGGSLILAASEHSLYGNPANAKFTPGVWNAVHGGISLPVGNGIIFHTETSLVMEGVRVRKEWVGGPPVILVLGLSYELR
jgi:hypothetical protein